MNEMKLFSYILSQKRLPRKRYPSILQNDHAIQFQVMTKKEKCGIMVIMKLVIFKANIAIMILPKYRPMYRMALYAMMTLFLVQVISSVAALAMKKETSPQVVAKISIICNILSLIASLPSFWVSSVITERTEEEQITISDRLGRSCCLFLITVGYHSPYILSLMSSCLIILSADDALLGKRLLFALLFSAIPFLGAVIGLISDIKEQLQWERAEELLLQGNRTTGV
jgi:hypothetical protein